MLCRRATAGAATGRVRFACPRKTQSIPVSRDPERLFPVYAGLAIKFRRTGTPAVSDRCGARTPRLPGT